MQVHIVYANPLLLDIYTGLQCFACSSENVTIIERETDHPSCTSCSGNSVVQDTFDLLECHALLAASYEAARLILTQVQ